VGVQQAQEFGVRVHLVGIRPSRGSQSLFLLQEADVTYEWSEQEVASFLSCTATIEEQPVPALRLAVAPAAGRTDSAAASLELVAEAIARSIERTELAAVIEAFDVTRQVPVALDRRLLGRSRVTIGRQLNSDEKKLLRAEFIRVCRMQLGDAERV
jgi:hypothetical protein